MEPGPHLRAARTAHHPHKGKGVIMKGHSASAHESVRGPPDGAAAESRLELRTRRDDPTPRPIMRVPPGATL